MFLIALGFLGGLFHVGHQQMGILERGAAADIRSRLQGPNAEVRVRTQMDLGALDSNAYRVEIRASHFSTQGLPLFTEPERSQSGRVRHLDLDMRDFNLKGLHIERLHASIPDSRFDLMLALRHRVVRISKSGTGDATVQVLAKDLESFVLYKYHEIKSINIKLERGRFLMEGRGDFLVASSDFKIEGALVPQRDRQICLKDAKIWFDGQAAEDSSAQILLDFLNPIVDIDRDLGLAGAVDLEWVTTNHGRLSAGGRTRIPNRPIISN